MRDDTPAGVNPGQGRRKLVIAIDGPAGSGKSTLAALLASRATEEAGRLVRPVAVAERAGGSVLDRNGDRLRLAAEADHHGRTLGGKFDRKITGTVRVDNA